MASTKTGNGASVIFIEIDIPPSPWHELDNAIWILIHSWNEARGAQLTTRNSSRDQVCCNDAPTILVGESSCSSWNYSKRRTQPYQLFLSNHFLQVLSDCWIGPVAEKLTCRDIRDEQKWYGNACGKIEKEIRHESRIQERSSNLYFTNQCCNACFNAWSDWVHLCTNGSSSWMSNGNKHRLLLSHHANL